jgi:hypothetical protein
MTKVVKSLTKRSDLRFSLPHLPNMRQVTLPHLYPCVLLWIGQDLGCLMHQFISMV